MAAGFTAVDLSQLAPPDVVEMLDFETIFSARKAELIALYPEDQQGDIAATLELESEPITKMLQESAYRELLLRSRVNDAARAVMLAYANDADLDQIGANYKMQRLLLDAGDPTALPPVPATWESNDDFRRRIQLSPEGYTTAGSQASYKFHAMGADADVRDAQPVSPAPGQITVYVLSRTGNGAAGQPLLNTVATALNAESLRPMTDQVATQSAAITEYQLNAALTVYPGPDAELIRQRAEDAVTAYVAAQHQLGYDVTLSGLYAALHQPGVQNVTLISPLADIVMGDGEAAYCTSVTVSVGGADV